MSYKVYDSTNRPNNCFTRGEIKTFNIDKTENNESVGILQRKNKKQPSELYDLGNTLVDVKFLTEKDDMIGLYTKKECRKLEVSVSKTEKVHAIFYDKKNERYVGLYKRKDHERTKEIMEESQSRFGDLKEKYKDLPYYNSKTIPENLKCDTMIGKYYLREGKEPVAIYMTNSRRLRLIYDISDQLEKKHYSIFDELPPGYISEFDIISGKYKLDANNKEPIAYIGQKGRMKVIPVYDFTHLPQFRIRHLLHRK